jgi:hypothetical protein
MREFDLHHLSQGPDPLPNSLPVAGPNIVLTHLKCSPESLDFSQLKLSAENATSPYPSSVDFDTSFDEAARKALHIHGLVPPAIEGFSKQEKRCKLGAVSSSLVARLSLGNCVSPAVMRGAAATFR